MPDLCKLPEVSDSTLMCTPWLLAGLGLMGLNAYVPQLSLVSSFWYSFRAAISVIHWAAFWWFVSSGWKLNLVSLAPLSYKQQYTATTFLLSGSSLPYLATTVCALDPEFYHPHHLTLLQATHLLHLKAGSYHL
ncbi:hypothetical protein DSO57_1008974 [Entomophthora muscae]|uniref:Uncharacterized protein n=1 Tax=Entomophthora muscae TaxID=34485 RepID=A0ACC2SVZ9_9FUNG|nr:hypothetical protein DSO57_1008974 [Entomophthora muscae]